jgi:sugar fermentation stimulation protein A
LIHFDTLLQGRLLRRYKRFLADVELADGSQLTVHCPNTGAMTGCSEPGAVVWLSTSDSRSRKYPHTWELVETSRGMACIHSARANAVVREAFARGRIPGFEDYRQIRSEVRYHDNSRADLLLEGEAGRVFVEVKSVTLCREGGQGVFPDAVSSRGRKHLQALQAIRDESTRALMFFCVFHQGIERVSAAGDIDPAYRDALALAMEAGVEVLAWATKITPAGLELGESLPFALDPLPDP